MHTAHRQRQDEGKPAAAIGIIAAMFAVAAVIKMLPPSSPPLPPALELTAPLASVSTLTWTPAPPALVPEPAAIVRRLPHAKAAAPVGTAAVAHLVEDVPMPLHFDSRPPSVPPAVPVLAASTPVSFELPATIAAESPDRESQSDLASAFVKTGSALRTAFVKTGASIKDVAVTTAKVF